MKYTLLGKLLTNSIDTYFTEYLAKNIKLDVCYSATDREFEFKNNCFYASSDQLLGDWLADKAQQGIFYINNPYVKLYSFYDFFQGNIRTTLAELDG
jgi:hypothetical protein